MMHTVQSGSPARLNRQQRRAMERQAAKQSRLQHHQPLKSKSVINRIDQIDARHVRHNGISHDDLTIPAYALLANLLERRDNKLSTNHKLALLALVGTMTEMAQHRLTGRLAFGLPTGTGKTTGIVAWCAVLTRLGLDHIGVAVAASKVEALCELKRELIAQGVPAERIGLVHSKKYDPNKLHEVRRGGPAADQYATEPSEGTDRQIMLVTHQRVRSCDLDSFNLYRGKPRDLLLYDESLIVSDSLGIPCRDLKGSVGWMSKYDGDEARAPLIAYLTECRDVIVDALQATKDNGTNGDTLELPVRTPDEIEGYRKLLGRHPAVDAAHHLLDIADQTIRVIPTGQGGVVWYNVSVPPDIKNILVLDASQPIRKLVHLDPTIKDAEKHLPQIKNVGVPLAQIKRFDRVTIKQMFAGGGRETMRDHFSRDRAEDRKVSQAVIDVVRAAPADEAVLIFTYKTRPTEKVDYRSILLADLDEAGVDVDATVKTPDGDRQRINVVTWGMETSTNDYDHCAHVILAGVLQRSPVDLAAAFLGQSDTLKGNVVYQQVKELQASEVCHMVYQALSRGRCRKVDQGMAKPMTGYIIHRDDLMKKELDKVMPGASWEVWQSEHFAASTKSIATLAHKIKDGLDTLPDDITKVSTMRLKKVVDGGVDAPTQTWNETGGEKLRPAVRN